jgi:hypothetical protein
LLYTPRFTWLLTFRLGINRARIFFFLCFFSFLLLFLLCCWLSHVWLIVTLSCASTACTLQVQFQGTIETCDTKQQERNEYTYVLTQYSNIMFNDLEDQENYQFLSNGCPSLTTTMLFLEMIANNNRGDCLQFDSNFILFPRSSFECLLL